MGKPSTAFSAVGDATTTTLTALFAVLLAFYNPIAIVWPAFRIVHICTYAGVLMLGSGSSVMRDRLLHAPRNWARFPLRSLVEWAFWLAFVGGAQRVVISTPGSACVAAALALAVCRAGDEATKLLERMRLARTAKSFDTAAGFFPDGSSIAPAGARAVSMAEVRSHNKRDDVWLVIDGAVIDVGRWAHSHPGGPLILQALGGRDATDQYRAFHGTSMGAKLRAMCVGRLEPSSADAPSAAQTEFRALGESLRARGAFAYPLRKTLAPMYLPLALMAAAVLVLARASSLDGSAALLLAALGGALAGLSWQQMSLFGHDLGHGNVTGFYADDCAIALVLTPIFGIGISWWKATHNTHHVLTNSETHDPDIQHMPVFAVSERMLRGFYSYYHQKVFAFDALAQGLLARQHVLYYPIMAVAKVNLYVQTHMYLLLNATQSSTLELAGMLCHYASIGLALYSLPTMAARAACFAAAMAVAGLLHVQITLSHFGMDTYEGTHYRASDESWWHKQLSGTIDVVCSPWLDWFHGGLQYQTVHHLYPRLPRFALRPASAEVAAAAEKSGLTYHRASFGAANLLVLNTLRKTARACRSAAPGAAPGAPLVWDALNARG